MTSLRLYPDHTADEIVTAMMEKYGAREDVTEKDLRDCIDDVEALKQAGKAAIPRTPSRTWPVRSRSVPATW